METTVATSRLGSRGRGRQGCVLLCSRHTTGRHRLGEEVVRARRSSPNRMTTDCTWHLLVPPGRIGAPQTIRTFDLLQRFSLNAFVGGRAAHLTAPDGDRVVPVDSALNAASWLSLHGGAIAFADRHGNEVTMSIHLLAGTLPSELSVVADKAAFDEVQFSISARSAGARTAAWRFFDGHILQVANELTAELAWCLSEDVVESIGVLPAHLALHNGDLPTFPAAAIAVPATSPLAAELLRRSAAADQVVTRHDDWIEARDSRGLWPGQTVVRPANSTDSVSRPTALPTKTLLANSTSSVLAPARWCPISRLPREAYRQDEARSPTRRPNPCTAVMAGSKRPRR